MQTSGNCAKKRSRKFEPCGGYVGAALFSGASIVAGRAANHSKKGYTHADL